MWVAENDRRFPDLQEGTVYRVMNTSGLEEDAEFCMGGGEYWWLDTVNNREIAISYYWTDKQETPENRYE